MTRLPPPSVADSARGVFVASVVVTGLLYLVPYGDYVAYPLLLLSTLVHELGHGIAAVFMGGEFDRFVMFADGSGVARHSGFYSGWQIAFIAGGGLVGPAMAASVGFVCARREKSARVFLVAVAIALLAAEILVVRNLFGGVFAGALIVLCAAVAAFGSAAMSQYLLVFLSVQLALSVFSRGDYLFTDTAVTAAGAMPSDSAQMAEGLFGPYWLWGGVCGAVSILALVIGAWWLLRGSRPGKTAPL